MTHEPLPLDPSKPLRPSPLAVGLLLAMILITFAPLCFFEFTSWDDQTFIVENPRMAHPSWENATHYWSAGYYSLYVPLTTSVWMLLGWASKAISPDPITGLNPHWFHTPNVILHALTALAAYAVGRRVLRSHLPALATAVVVGLHPLQVESVGWVSGLKDVLAGLLTLGSIAVYLDAIGDAQRASSAASPQPDTDPDSPLHWRNRSMTDTDSPRAPAVPTRRRRAWRYGLASLLFLLAMLAKPSAMMTAPIVLVIDLTLLRRRWTAALVWALPWLILGGAFALIARNFQPPAINAFDVPLMKRPLVVGYSLAFYLGKIVWPTGLSVDYGVNPSAILASRWLYTAWIVPAVAIFAAAALWKRSRVPAAGLAIFILAPLHTLGLVAYDFQRISTVADHYLYVALLGVGLIVGWGVSHLRPRSAMAVVILLAIAMASRSYDQTLVWRNSLTLLGHTLAVNPRSWAAENSLAVLDWKAGRSQRAVDRAARAIALNPTDPLPYLVRGSIVAGKGDLPAATAEFQRAVDVAPNHAGALANLGGILAAEGRFNEALVLLQRAIAADPDDAQARLNLGALQAQQGDIAAAARSLEIAVGLSPTDVRAHMNLGYVLLQLQRRHEATAHFQAAAAADPANPAARDALRRLGVSAP